MIGDKRCPKCGRYISWGYATNCYHCEHCGIDFNAANRIFAPIKGYIYTKVMGRRDRRDFLKAGRIKMEDEIITWDEWEKKENKAIIDSISIAIGELKRRGITDDVLIEKLCLKRTAEKKSEGIKERE